jgi:predicted RNA-binding protein with PIN domain
MSKGDTQRARQLLVEDLENLRSLKGWRIECIFDGAGKSISGPLGGRTTRATPSDRALHKDISKHGVRVVFTGVGVEADTYIEARCAQAKNVTSGKLTGSFIIATDDSMIRLAGQSAGAMCMSADRFVDELKSMKKAIEYRVEFAMAKVNGVSIRPEKLRGTSIHLGTFGRGSFLIEDKRNRTKVKKERAEEQHETALDVVVEKDGNEISWWAQPNQTLRK